MMAMSGYCGGGDEKQASNIWSVTEMKLMKTDQY